MIIVSSLAESARKLHLGREASPVTLERATVRRLTLPPLTLDHIWLVLPPLVLLMILNLQTITPNDFWWHLRTGQIILQSGSIPNVDLFTFSRSGVLWTNQSWLSEVIFYLLYRTGGPALVLFWYALTMTAGYTCLELACLTANGGKLRSAAAATMIAVILGIMTWTVRPQALSFALFGLVLLIIEHNRMRGGRSIWWLPLIFAFWTNLHGGFVFGLGLLGVYVIMRLLTDLAARQGIAGETRRVAIAGMASLLALAFNPSGLPGIVEYVLGFLHSSATQNLNMEFQPLTVRQGDGMLFVGFVILFLLVLYLRPRRLPAHYVVGMLLFGVLAMQSLRVLPWFGMTAGPACAWLFASERLAEPQTRRNRDRPALNCALAGLLACCVLVTLPWFRLNLGLLPAERRTYTAAESTPVEATVQLCALGSNTRTFAEIGYASYLAWACPTAPFFMDTRFELYPREMWDDYLLISQGQFGWQETLHKYDITTILARKSDQKMLVAALKATDSWRLLYEDDDALLAKRADF